MSVLADPSMSVPESPAWPWPVRIAFRYCFLYFGLFCLTTQILSSLLPLPFLLEQGLPDASSLAPLRAIVFWVGGHLFGATLPMVYQDSGSGDKTFDWVLVFCILVVSAAGTAMWSALVRGRSEHAKLYRWFRLFLRFALASQMIVYGMDKAIPLQMPFPYLTRLLEPFGNFSPMGVLWSSVGASRPYEVAVGCAELLGGVLLIVPRTTVLGLLLSLGDMAFVFLLNMTYDVPVKLFSFHLILLCLVLLAPNFQGLVQFFWRQAPARLAAEPRLFESARRNRIALSAQLLFGFWLVAANLYSSVDAWGKFGGGRPRSPLYGIWTVTEMAVNGQVRAPRLDDGGRWRRILFDFPERASFQRMNDTYAHYGVTIDEHAHTVVLKKTGGQTAGTLTYERPTPSRLTMGGTMDGEAVRLQLDLMDQNEFLLVSRGFHWIQEYPVNR